MKKAITINASLVFIFLATQLFGQTISSLNSGEYISDPYQENDAQHPCITAEEYQLLNKQCEENIKLLGLDKNQHSPQLTTTLDWPIKAAAGFTDCDYYFIGAYVDQNTAVGPIQDFDCGTNTYDGHHGTDIAAWPYGFYKMDNSQVEVVAAAAGTIIQKADGNFDRNCTSNQLTANSIIIQHADGSVALYWHMKSGAVTEKNVGETVVAGEYLGVVGSSGSSSGPHLHFEVWTGITNDTYNDPYSGACNTVNATSWWNNQKPEINSALIKVSVNTTDLVLPGCPTTETPNESDLYVVPFQGEDLAPGYAKFYLFIRDDVAGYTADCKILNPDGSTFNSWTYTSALSSKATIYGYSKKLPLTPGFYSFEVTYQGATCSKTFEIQSVTSVVESISTSSIEVFPNPSTGKMFLRLGNENQIEKSSSIQILNSTGKVIEKRNIASTTKEIELNLLSGFYFYNITNEDGSIIKSGKLVIE